MSRFDRLRAHSDRLVVILAVTSLLLGQGCGGPGSQPPELMPLPELDLGGAEDSARQQLVEHRVVAESSAAGLFDGRHSDWAATAQAFGDLGQLYLTYDFLDSAEVCFRNALDLEPGDYRWHYLLGYLVMTQGQLEVSIPAYQRALELRPDFLPAMLRLGRVHLGLGRSEDARQWFERALALEPGIAAGHEGLGKAAAAIGDMTTAVASFRRALDLEPAATGIHYALAQAYRDLGDLDQTRVHLEQSGDVAARIVDPLINPLASLALSVQFYLVQGAEALDDDDAAAAVAAYRSALELDDRSFPAYEGLAAGLERLGDLAGVRETLDRALQLTVGEEGAPHDDRSGLERAAVHRSLGRLASQQGLDSEAVAHYEASLDLQPEQPGVLLRTANALARQRRFEEAITHYDQLVSLSPQWAPAVWEKRAAVWVNLGRRDEAVADFRRAVEAAPEDLRLRQLFADALQLMGDAPSAVEQRRVAEGLVAAGADRLPLLLAEARRSVRQQDFERAVEHFRQVIALDPEALEVRRELADVLGHVRRYDEAIVEYERILSEMPRLEAARRGKVVALILGGRLGEARLELQTALRTFPRHHGFALTQVRLLALSPDPDVRDGSLALQIARRVFEDRQDLPVRQALALALASAGNFEEAVTVQRDLVAVVGARKDLADIERARLGAFERGEAWTARTADEILVALGAG